MRHVKEEHNEEEINYLKAIMGILEAGNGTNKKIDIEILMSTLKDLSNRRGNPLIPFYKPEAFLIENNDQVIATLEKDIKNFIRRKAIAQRQNVAYLRGLFRFPFPLFIFSVNYDTCIEQYCYDRKNLLA